MVASIKEQIEYANSLKKAIADPLFIVDTNMVVTYMNKACEELTGYSKKEAEGEMTCQELLKSDTSKEDCPVQYCFETGRPVEKVQVVMTNRQGRQIPLMASASPLRNAQGVLIGGVEICKDITDVLEAERLRYIQNTAELEEEQRKYLETRARNLFDTLTQVANGNFEVRAEVLSKMDMMDDISLHINQMFDNLEKLYGKISSFFIRGLFGLRAHMAAGANSALPCR